MKKIFIASIILILIASPTLLYFIYKNQKISCTNNLTLIKNKGKLSLTAGQRMSNGKGMITLVGTLYRKDGSKAHINRKILFDYHYNYDFMITKSTSINIMSENNMSDAETREWISDFFITPGAELSLVMNRIGLNAWLNFTNPVPLSICEK